jgi:superfamily II DNA/RNA helicase
MPVYVSPSVNLMSQVPITFDASTAVPFDNVRGLDARLAAAARDTQRYVSLFPVQAAVWRELAGGLSTAHDLCICAPTGSGKTLSYALPVLQSLASAGGGARQGGVHLLRALVVLPTRDLAVQVSTDGMTAAAMQMLLLRLISSNGHCQVHLHQAGLVHLQARC